MWMQISSGDGPDECCRFVYLFFTLVKEECNKQNIKIEVLDFEEGNIKDTYKSIFLQLKGEKVFQYVDSQKGSHLWICKSSFRKNHQRKNWFIDVKVFDDENVMEFDAKDIVIEKMRSSGKGGQHVNKTETAVRIIHKSTGIVVKAMEERSQFQNIKLAKARLSSELKKLKNDHENSQRKERWIEAKNIIRGNPIRTFKEDRFIEITNK